MSFQDWKKQQSAKPVAPTPVEPTVGGFAEYKKLANSGAVMPKIDRHEVAGKKLQDFTLNHMINFQSKVAQMKQEGTEKKVLQVEPVDKQTKAPTFGERAKGAGLSLAKGFMGAVKTVPSVANFAGNLVSDKFDKSAIGKATNWTNEQFDFAMETAQDLKPEVIKELESNQIIYRGEDGKLKVNAPNADQVVNMLIEQIPQLPVYFAGGAGVKAVGAAVSKLPVVTNLASKSEKFSKALKTIEKYKDPLAQGTVNAPIIGGQTFDDALKTVFDELKAEGLGDEEAYEIAKQEALAAGKTMAPISFFTGMGLGGAMSSKGNVVSRAGKGFVAEGIIGEAPEETLQSATVSRAAKSAKGEETTLLKEAMSAESLNAGAMGAIVGGTMGTGVAVMSGRAEKPKQSEGATKDGIDLPEQQDFSEKLVEIANNIEKQLGKESAEQFKKEIGNKTFKNEEEFISAVDNIAGNLDGASEVETQEQKAPTLQDALLAVSEGKTREATNIARDLPIEEKQKVVEILEKSFERADKDTKKKLKDQIDQINDDVESEKLIAEDKIPVYEKNKELEKDNEYIDLKDDEIEAKQTEVKQNISKLIETLNTKKKTLLAQKQSVPVEKKKEVQKKIDKIDEERIEAKNNLSSNELKAVVAKSKKMQETVNEIKKLDKDFKLANHKNWDSKDFEKKLKELKKPTVAKKETVEEEEVTENTQEQTEDWEDNYAEKYGKLDKKVSKLGKEIKEAKGEEKTVLEKKQKKLVEKQAKMEQEFIDKNTKEKETKTGFEDLAGKKLTVEKGAFEGIPITDIKTGEAMGVVTKRESIDNPKQPAIIKPKEEAETLNSKTKKDEGNRPNAVSDTSDLQPKDDLGSSKETARKTPRHGREDVLAKLGDGLGTTRPDGLTKKQRQLINEEVESLLESKNYSQLPDDYTTEDRLLMSQYSGAGGKESVGGSGAGLLNEYYTPEVVVDKMWEIAQSIHPDIETAFEPSAGIGKIIGRAPNGVTIDGAEISKVSGTIANVLYPESDVSIGDFQELFFDPKTNKKKEFKQYDILIGNPPFGVRKGFLKGKGEESSIGRMEEYWIKRGLDMTKEGGILIYVVNSSFLQTGSSKGKLAIAKLGTLIDAYRLPEKSFADTSIGTDIIVVQKNTKPSYKNEFNDKEMLNFLNDNYFISHSENVLGETKTRKNRFGKEETYVEGSLDEAMKKIKLEKKSQKKAKKQSKPVVAKKTTSAKNAQVKPKKKVPKQKPRTGGKSLIMPKKNAEKLVAKSQNISNAAKVSKGSVEMLKKVKRDLSIENPTKAEKLELNFDGNGYYPDAMYYSGNVYKKLDKLVNDKKNIISEIGEDRYNKQLEKLKSITPANIPLSEISFDPMDRHIADLEYNKDLVNGSTKETTVMSSFIESMQGYENRNKFALSPRVAIYDIVNYVRGGRLGNGKKQILGLIKSDAKRLFENFIRRDLQPDVQKAIEEKYNKEKNGYVKPDYSMIPVEIKDMAKQFRGQDFKMSQTQKEGVSFLVNKGSGILAYGVGVGKTHTLAIATKANMDKGWTKRPFFAVPKATITETWLATLHEMFPTVKINNLEGLQAPIVRKLKKERGEDVKDWIRDGEFTVISHDGLLRLGFNPDELTEATQDLEDAIWKEDTVKTKRKAEETKGKVDEILGRAQKYVTDIMLSDLGIDHISVDEVHNFRKVFQGAKIEKDKNGVSQGNKRFTNVIGGTPSKRAQQLFLLTQYIQKKNQNRNVFLASATPFENQATEVYNILSLVARDRLKEMGIININDFFAAYANFEVELDRRLDGEWVNREKMKSFGNFESLRSLIREFIDFQEDETLVRPEKKVFTPQLQMSEMQEANLAKIQELLTGISSDGEGNIEVGEKADGAFLKASTYSVANSVSPYFIKEFVEGTPTAKEIVSQSPKIEYALEVAKAMRDDKKTKDSGLFVFMGKVGVEYHPMLAEHFAKELGYKPSEVAYVSGKVTDSQKETIKQDFNSGKVKVLIGGDQTKEGIDLQMNGFATINLALGWNPSQITQVGGRVWRQGNRKNFVAEIFPLVENSGDVMIYNKFEEKSGRINQIAYASGKTVDVGEVDASEKKLALLTNPEDKARLEIELTKTSLDVEKVMLEDEITNAKGLIDSKSKLESSIEYFKKEIEREWNTKEEKKKYKVEVKKLESKLETLSKKVKALSSQNPHTEIEILTEKLNVVKQKIEKILDTKPALLKKYTDQYNDQVKNRKSIADHVKEISGTFSELSEYTEAQLAEMKNKKIAELEARRAAEMPAFSKKAESELTQKARKYKSAEDFVKSQGDVLYHTTPSNFDKFDSELLGTNTNYLNARHGFYFADNLDLIEEFKERLREGFGGSFTGDAESKTSEELSNYRLIEKVADKNKFYDFNYSKNLSKKEARIFAEFAQKEWGGLYNQEGELLDSTKMSDEQLLRTLDKEVFVEDLDPDSSFTPYFMEHELGNFAKFLEEKGYTGMKTNFGNGKDEFMVFNPNELPDKSELVDIWNKANEKPRFSKKLPTFYIGKEDFVMDEEVYIAERDYKKGRKSFSQLPILVMKVGDSYEFLDGRHRYIQQKAAGRTEFLVTTDVEAYKKASEIEEGINIGEYTKKDGTNVTSHNRKLKKTLFERQDYIERLDRKPTVEAKLAIKRIKALAKRFGISNLETDIAYRIFTGETANQEAEAVYWDAKTIFTQFVSEFAAEHEFGHGLYRNIELFKVFKDNNITREGLLAELKEKYPDVENLEEQLMVDMEVYLQKKMKEQSHQEKGIIGKFFESVWKILNKWTKPFEASGETKIEKFYNIVFEGYNKEDVALQRNKQRPEVSKISSGKIIDFGRMRNVAFSRKEMFSTYKEMLGFVDNVEGVLANISTELAQAEAGKKIFTEAEKGGAPEVTAQKSTFPKWMPEGTRTRKTIDAVLPLLNSVETLTLPKNKNELALMESIFARVDKLAGINTADIRADIAKEVEVKTEAKSQDIIGETGNLKVATLIKQVYQEMYGEELKIFGEIENADLITKGTKKAFTEGKRVQKQASRSRFTAKAWQMRKQFARDKESLLKKFDSKETNRANFRKALEQIVADLPVNMRREFLSQKIVFDIKGRGTLVEALNRVEKLKIRREKQRMLKKARQKVVALIVIKDLKKTDNLRKAMKFPRLSKMKLEQVEEFAQVIKKAKFGDVFLTQRQLETVKNTELAGIKTTREARKVLADKYGVTEDEVKNIKVSALDRFRYDTALAEKNVFYKLMVQDTYQELLSSEERFTIVERKTNELIKKARRSRERGFLDFLIPTDKVIFKYLEAKAEVKVKMAQEMTTEELEAAEYIKEQYAEMRDYLVENKMMKKYIKDYVTHIRRGFFETWKEDGFVTAFKEIKEQQAQDEAMFNILSDTGEILPLEKFFKFAMTRKGKLAPTQNIARSFLVYKKSFETKRALDATMPKLDVYVSSLTPEMTTERGLEVDRSLKKFFNSWMNSKKGRATDFGGVVPVGGWVDISLRSAKAFTTIIDLGFSLPLGVATQVGEQITNYIMLGAKDYAKGNVRMITHQGRKIIDKYENFVGKSVWDDLTQAGDDFSNKMMKSLFVMFAQASRTANEQFLLGNMTKEEFQSGEISPERLATLKNEMGRFRVTQGSKSVVGATSVGGIMTQYKTWAIPIMRTTYKDLTTVKRKGIKSREAQELFRIAVFTSAVIFMAAGAEDDEDDRSLLAQMKRKVIRESLTLIGALDPTMIAGEARVMNFTYDLASAIKQLITLEEYKASKKGEYQKGDLKAPRAFQRALEPTIIKQFKD